MGRHTDWLIDIILFNKKRRETVLKVSSHLGLVNLRVRTYHNNQTYYTRCSHLSTSSQ
jgi:hypothetical protein